MLRALYIAIKDVRVTYRNIPALVMMFLGPLLLATAIGSAFGTGDNFVIPAVKTAVVNPPEASPFAAGALIGAALASPQLADFVRLTHYKTPEDARTAVDQSKEDVAVIIPPGLTATLMGATSNGAASGTSGTTYQPVFIEIYKKPGNTLGPAIVASVVNSVLSELQGARAAAVASANLAFAQGVTDQDQLISLAQEAARAFMQTSQTQRQVRLETRPPAIQGVSVSKRPNVASQVLVGMMLFFMLFGGSIPARGILEEHRAGTLPRLFTTPTRRTTILGGKYLAVFLVVLIQSTVLVIAGWLLLGADWGPLGPVTVLIVCGALAAASLALFCVSFAKTPGEAGAVSSSIFVAMALISGNFFGTANVGETFAKVRRVSPLGWLMEAWGRLLYGGSWADIALPVVAVLGFAVLFFALATYFFRKRYA